MCSILLGKAILHNVQQNPESAGLYRKKKGEKKREEGCVCVCGRGMLHQDVLFFFESIN